MRRLLSQLSLGVALVTGALQLAYGAAPEHALVMAAGASGGTYTILLAGAAVMIRVTGIRPRAASSFDGASS